MSDAASTKGPTLREIVEFTKTTQAYRDAVARDNETTVERMARSPLLRALAQPASPTMMLVQPKAYRLLQWHWTEADKWAGRDWRRIKRERNRFERRA